MTKKHVGKKWVLREACGYYVALDKLFGTQLIYKSRATVFDSRDNPALKIAFFEATTGGKFTVENL